MQSSNLKIEVGFEACGTRREGCLRTANGRLHTACMSPGKTVFLEGIARHRAKVAILRNEPNFLRGFVIGKPLNMNRLRINER